MRHRPSRPVVAAFASLAICAAAAPARAAVSFSADFESGDLRAWGEFYNPANLGVVTAPVRNGRFAAKIELVGAASRGELVTGVTDRVAGRDTYVAVSLYTPATSPVRNANVVFVEASGVPWNLRVVDGRLALQMKDPARTALLAPLAADRWYDVVLHVWWAEDPALGGIEVFLDGARALDRIAGATVPSGHTGGAFHLGLSNYPRRTTTAVETLFVDDVRMATTLAEVRPAGPPLDAGATAQPPDPGVVGPRPDAAGAAADAAAARSDAGSPAPAVAADGGPGVVDAIPVPAPGPPAAAPARDPAAPATARRTPGGCHLGADGRAAAHPLLIAAFASARRRRRRRAAQRAGP